MPKLCLTRAHSGSLQRTPTHVAVGSFSFAARQRQRVRVTKTGSVRKVLSCSQLSTNPFAFEGEKIAVVVHLEAMLDRDEALFGRECMVVLIGQVIGKTEVEIPLGSIPAAHLTPVYIFAGNRIVRSLD